MNLYLALPKLVIALALFIFVQALLPPAALKVLAILLQLTLLGALIAAEQSQPFRFKLERTLNRLGG